MAGLLHKLLYVSIIAGLQAGCTPCLQLYFGALDTAAVTPRA